MSIISLYIVYAIVTIVAFFKNTTFIRNGIIDNRSHKFEYSAIIMISVILILICVYRPSYMKDYLQYETNYYNGYGNLMEQSFFFIARLAPTFLSLLAIYATLSISIRMLALKWISISFWVSLFVWLSRYFTLHDMIQIRAAVAAALFLFAIPFLMKNKIIYISIILLATLFHTSAITYLLFVVLSCKYINKPVYLCLIPFSFLLGGLDFNLRFIVNILLKYSLFDHYNRFFENNSYNNFENENLLGIMTLLPVIMAFLLVLYSSKLQKVYPYAIIITKIYVIAIISRPLLWNINNSGRITELLSVVEVLAIPMLVVLFTPKRNIILYCLPFVYYVTLFVMRSYLYYE